MLALGPFQFSTKLRAARPGLHRWMGRLYLGAGVLVGGAAGLYVAFHAFGGPVGRACLALYRTIAWLCWVPNLILAELLFNRTPRGWQSA